MEKNKYFSRLWIKLLGYLFIIIAVILAISLIRVQNIECFAKGELDKSFCETLDGFKGKSLFFTDFSDDESIQALSFSQDESYTYYLENISKRLPDTLILNFTTQAPLYRIKIGDATYLINEGGEFKKDLPQLDVPAVEVGGEWLTESGERSDRLDKSTHVFVSSLIREAGEQGIFFQKINLVSYMQVDLFPSQNLKIIIEKSNQVEKDVGRISVLLKNLDFESFGDKIRKIDMRFDFPILNP